MSTPQPLVPLPLLKGKATLAEGPYWHSASQSLYFTDIPAGRLWRFDPATKSADIFYEGNQPLGGFTLQQDGNWLLFRRSDIVLLDAAGRELSSLPLQIEGAARCNDVIAAPCGRVYFGTIGVNSTSGGLYCLDTEGRVTCILEGTACANGMAFSPCRNYFYWTDTTARTIYRFRYDQASGALRDQQRFYVCPESEGLPDGLVTDATGRLWSARWGGAMIVVICATGEKIVSIALPEANITSLVWGGSGLSNLYITAARGESTPELADLFVIENAACGLSEFCSGIVFGNTEKQ